MLSNFNGLSIEKSSGFEHMVVSPALDIGATWRADGLQKRVPDGFPSRGIMGALAGLVL